MNLTVMKSFTFTNSSQNEGLSPSSRVLFFGIFGSVYYMALCFFFPESFHMSHLFGLCNTDLSKCASGESKCVSFEFYIIQYMTLKKVM
jgi:hypothetical protein